MVDSESLGKSVFDIAEDVIKHNKKVDDSSSNTKKNDEETTYRYFSIELSKHIVENIDMYKGEIDE